MRISIDAPMIRRLLIAVVFVSSATVARAETGAGRLAPLRAPGRGDGRRATRVPCRGSIVTLETAAPIQKARDELLTGIRGMLGVEARPVTELSADGAIIVGTLARLRQSIPGLLPDGAVAATDSG